MALLMLSQKGIRLLIAIDSAIEANSKNSLESLSKEIQNHYVEDLTKFKIELLLSSLQQICGIIVLLIMLVINTRKTLSQKHELSKKILIILAFALDVPVFHSFSNQHVLFTLAFQALYTFAIVNFFCWKTIEAIIIYLLMALILIVQTSLYFDYEFQILDFIAQVIFFLAFKLIVVQQNYRLIILKTESERKANDKISEYQKILNTFPEGFFMASYRHSIDTETSVLP